MRFQLVSGYHIEQSPLDFSSGVSPGTPGRTLDEGSVVESDKDLAKAFPGKFVRVSDDTLTKAIVIPAGNRM